jgi:hypothetical protein
VGPGGPTLRGERVEDITFEAVDRIDTTDAEETAGDEERPWFYHHPWVSGLILAGVSAVIGLVIEPLTE